MAQLVCISNGKMVGCFDCPKKTRAHDFCKSHIAGGKEIAPKSAIKENRCLYERFSPYGSIEKFFIIDPNSVFKSLNGSKIVWGKKSPVLEDLTYRITFTIGRRVIDGIYKQEVVLSSIFNVLQDFSENIVKFLNRFSLNTEELDLLVFPYGEHHKCSVVISSIRDKVYRQQSCTLHVDCFNLFNEEKTSDISATIKLEFNELEEEWA